MFSQSIYSLAQLGFYVEIEIIRLRMFSPVSLEPIKKDDDRGFQTSATGPVLVATEMICIGFKTSSAAS